MSDATPEEAFGCQGASAGCPSRYLQHLERNFLQPRMLGVVEQLGGRGASSTMLPSHMKITREATSWRSPFRG